MEAEMNGVPYQDETGNQNEIGDSLTGPNNTELSQDPQDDNGNAEPMRKIHTKHHSSGRYRMFSNHSSANDFPRTSTGI